MFISKTNSSNNNWESPGGSPTSWRLNLNKRVHMVGVKGVGMAALAEVLVKNGFIVSGSDAKDDFITAGALKRLNINITEFSAENVKNAEAVIRSNAYNSDNTEVRAAQNLNT